MSSWWRTVGDAGHAAGLAFRVAPVPAVVALGLTILDGIAPVAGVWATKVFMDSVADPAGASTVRIGCAVAALVGATLLVAVNKDILVFLQGAVHRQVEIHTRAELLTAVNAHPGVRHLENPAYQDRLTLADESGSQASQQVTVTALAMIRTVVSAAGWGVALAAVWPPMIFVVSAGIAPAVWAHLKLARRSTTLAEQTTTFFRRMLFFRMLIVEPRAAREIRQFGLGTFFADRLLTEMRSSAATHAAFDRRTLRLELGLSVLDAAVLSAGVIAAAVLAIAGRVSVGDIAVLLAAAPAIQGTGAMTAVSIASAYSAVLLYGTYRSLVAEGARAQEEQRAALARTAAVEPSAPRGIEFRDVWFRYDADGPWILRGLTVLFPAGKHIALLGLNGAGKSTLVKLVCRMYVPDSGRILWDGVDVSTIPSELMRSRMAVLFQDFMTYDLTAAENIAVGEISALGDPQRIRAAAAQAGVHNTLFSLPAGYDTLLSLTFAPAADHRAALLSGGQWQRVALARAFLRSDAELLILDEPGAALDPLAEHDLSLKLAELRKDRTSIIVTHRLGTTRDVDILVLVDEGQVVEFGSHQELMARSERYRQLYELQAARFANEVTA